MEVKIVQFVEQFSQFCIDNVSTVVFLPLWIFSIVILGRFFDVLRSKKIISSITLSSTLIGIIFSVGVLIKLINFPGYTYENQFDFINLQNYILSLGVYVDKLSAVMLVVVTTISFLVQLYSAKYMSDDKSFARFFAYLNLFNFSMLGLVLSPNLFQNYIFWELVGVSSYLLIGFWYKKPSASYAAKKAFIINRIGDFGLLVGTIVISYFMYNYASVTSLATMPFENISSIGSYLYAFTNDAVFALICIMLLMGAFAKSAQFPLHTWLADAMEGPTPVSALIHSATMVAAGVYLVARLYPMLILSDYVMQFIAIIGFLTALIGSYIAITQNDLKRILAYSTNSQLGLMFMALGCGAFSGGMFHLITHAYFKSMLFLASGVVIHSLLGTQDIRFMGGLRKHLPVVATCYFIGCIAISGLLFTGFYSKELMLTEILSNNHEFFGVGFLLVALLTSFYMFRSYFVVFEGQLRSEKAPHKSNLWLNISIIILTLVTIFAGPFLNDYLPVFIEPIKTLGEHSSNIPLYIPLGIAFSGFILAFLLYNTKLKPIKVPFLYAISYQKLYIDDLYKLFVENTYSFFSRVSAFIDKYIVDGFVVLMKFLARGFSWVLAKMQTGNFQSYLTYSVIFLAVVFAGLMFAYSLIIYYGFS